MKRTLSMLLALSLILFCSGFAFAGDDVSDAAGSITLLDTSGPGPGVLAIPVSNLSFVSYSGASAAGGYGGIAGQVMACTSVSSKPRQQEGIYFAVRGAQDPAMTDDNNLYQRTASDVGIALSQCTTYVDTDFSSWQVRGGT